MISEVQFGFSLRYSTQRDTSGPNPLQNGIHTDIWSNLQPLMEFKVYWKLNFCTTYGHRNQGRSAGPHLYQTQQGLWLTHHNVCIKSWVSVRSSWQYSLVNTVLVDIVPEIAQWHQNMTPNTHWNDYNNRKTLLINTWYKTQLWHHSIKYHL